jgi:FMN-dependent NADH-azoreductase
LTKQFVNLWKQIHPDDAITYRDLGQHPVPPINEAWIAAAFSSPEQLTPSLETALMTSNQLIDELLAADVFVFGVPMYNYSVPASFKAYIDQVVLTDITFIHAENLAMGADERQYSITAAHKAIHQVITALAT